MKKIAIVLLAASSLATPALARDNSSDTNSDVNKWVNHLFKEADTDHNGKLSKQEYLDYAEKKFDQMDSKGNGELTKDEVVAYKTDEMQKHHKRHAAMKDSARESSSANATQDTSGTNDHEASDQNRDNMGNEAQDSSKNERSGNM